MTDDTDVKRTVITGPGHAAPRRRHRHRPHHPGALLAAASCSTASARHAFEDDRAPGADRAERPSVRRRRASRDARILLVNRSFGCGSSREHAPQAIMRWGAASRRSSASRSPRSSSATAPRSASRASPPTQRAIATLMERAEREPTLPFTLDLPNRRITAGDLAFAACLRRSARQQLIEWPAGTPPPSCSTDTAAIATRRGDSFRTSAGGPDAGPHARLARSPAASLTPARAGAGRALVTAMPWLVATLDHDRDRGRLERAAWRGARHGRRRCCRGTARFRALDAAPPRRATGSLRARHGASRPTARCSASPSRAVGRAREPRRSRRGAGGLRATARPGTVTDGARRSTGDSSHVAWRQTPRRRRRASSASRCPVRVALRSIVLRLRAPVAFGLVSALRARRVRRLAPLRRDGPPHPARSSASPAALAGGTRAAAARPERNDDLGRARDAARRDGAARRLHARRACASSASASKRSCAAWSRASLVTDLTGTSCC